MIQIQLSNITLVLGAERIFENLDWEIQAGQKIGLIGSNGAGKSSLLKLILGEYAPEYGGSVTCARLVTTGYLPQQPVLDLALTAFETALLGNPQIEEIHQQLDKVEASLGNPVIFGDERRLQQALEVHNRLMEAYSSLGGDSYPDRVRSLLLGLGLPEKDLGKSL
jgi:ATP-binding cassette subfamily F protein 3